MKTLSLSIAFSFTSIFSFSQVNPSLASALQSTLDNNIVAYGLEAVEATVITPYGCIWTGVSGWASPGSPADTIRKWHWGSVGKSMTATIVLQLDDEGLIDINDPIGMYLNVDTIPYLDGATTIKMLLNHTTDLNNSWSSGSNLWNDVWADRDSVWNIWSVLDSTYRSPGTPNPGLVHIYNGFDNYLMLGFLIEEVTGQSLDYNYINRVFNPLGFTNSTTITNGVNMADLNGVYNNNTNNGGLPHNSYMSTRGGTGNHIGSSRDVARFMRAFHKDELVSVGLMQEARMPTNGTPAAVPGTCLGDLEQTYGYGTNIINYINAPDTLEFYGHGGNGLGNSLVFHNIEYDITVALTTNDLSSAGQQGNFALFMDLICYIWDNLALTNCELGVEEIANQDKKLVRIVNLLGQETKYQPNTPLIYIYSDGSTQRVYNLD